MYSYLSIYSIINLNINISIITQLLIYLPLLNLKHLLTKLLLLYFLKKDLVNFLLKSGYKELQSLKS